MSRSATATAACAPTRRPSSAPSSASARRSTSHHTTSLVFNDPPLHTRVRKLLAAAFTPRALAAMQPRIEARGRRAAGRHADKGRMDLVEDFAFRLPVEVICDMLGVPPRRARAVPRAIRWPSWARWSRSPAPERQRRGNARGRRVLGLSRRADRRAAQAAGRRSRRAGHADPWRGRRRAAEPRRAGAELHLPAERRPRDHDQPDRQHGRRAAALSRRAASGCAAIPALIKSCVEEGLRFESSNQLGNRRLPRDLEIGGERLAAGTYIHIGIGAANRDPAQFPEPDRFDAGREPNRHFAFGSGVHMCLGAVLARMEGHDRHRPAGRALRRAGARRRPRARRPRPLPRLQPLSDRLERARAASP